MNVSEQQQKVLAQIKTALSLIVITPSKNQSLYSGIPSLTGEGITLVIMPSSSAISREMVFLKSLNSENHQQQTFALVSDLFPNQARKIISDASKKNSKILLLTPESFLYWFSSAFNPMTINHYQNLPDDDLGKQVFKNVQTILSKLSRIVLFKFELFMKENTLHKPKYLEAVSLLSELKKPVLGLSYGCSKKAVQEFLGFFPNAAVIHEGLRLNRIALRVNYVFSRLDKQKRLVELLNEKKPTLVYVSPTEDLADLVNYLRKNLPDSHFKAFHRGLSPEQRADALEYFLEDECPIFITSSDLIDGISPNKSTKAPRIARLIHYSPPDSLLSYYEELSGIAHDSDSKTLSESHLICCEDDFILPQSEELNRKATYNKDGLIIDSKQQKMQFLDWISQKSGCRWNHLENFLTFDMQQSYKCGICDLCVGEKKSVWNNLSLFFLKRKIR